MKKTLLSSLSCIALAAVFASGETPTIERVEFFVGEDPGYGNGTALPISAGLTSVDSVIEFPAGTLPDEPLVQVTIRAVDTAGNWSPPSPVTIIRPFLIEDGAPVISGLEYGIGDSGAMTASIPEGQTAIETMLEFPAELLPADGSEIGWVQATGSDGVRGLRTPFRVAAAPIDPFVGQEMQEIGGWDYAFLSGQTVVASGMSAATGEALTGLDFSSLDPGGSYTLILSPIAAGSGLPYPNIATNLNLITDYAWWQRQHFTGPDLTDSAVSGPAADPGESGMTNFERFFAGIGPEDPPRRFQAGIGADSENSGLFPLLTVERSRLAAFVDLVVEESVDLATWEKVPVVVIDSELTESGTERLLLHPESENPEAEERAFYRVSISGEAL